MIAFDESVTSSWEGKGAVIVTNVMLSSATAFVEDGDLTAANVTVARRELLDDGRDRELEDRVLGQPQLRARLQLDRLEGVEPPLQRDRRASSAIR